MTNRVEAFRLCRLLEKSVFEIRQTKTGVSIVIPIAGNFGKGNVLFRNNPDAPFVAEKVRIALLKAGVK